MSLRATTCPICKASNSRSLGPILHPRPALVAGVPIDLGNESFALRGCPSCGFQWKDPAIEPAKLMACYAAADADNWQIDPDARQRKFDLLRKLLERHATGRRILDVGCFNGALLKYLGDDWQKFGVEPSVAAAQLARCRGVDVLATSLDQLTASHGRFDAILAIDVVEHLVDPLPFFQQVRDHLVPGGVFVVGTGDTDSLAWRLQGSAYWYCSLPEHLSFYCRRTLDRIGEVLGMEGIEYRQLCHKRLPLQRWLSDSAKCAVYLLGRRVGGLGLPPLKRLFVDRRGPSIQSAKDHLLYVYRGR